MFADPQVNDFRVVVSSNDSGLDAFALIVELRRDSSATAAQDIAAKTKRIFEIGVDVQILETGAIAREFASSVKALRFVDERM